MKTTKGYEAFIHYYKDIYQNRWDRLLAAMHTEKPYRGIPEYSSHQYFLDEASFFASRLAYSLIVQYHCSNMLDMCAAPGGKLLGILHQLQGEHMTITVNEKSKNRFIRLKKNIQTFYTNDTEHCTDIRFTCKDANLFGKDYKNTFDFVLLDAPCSNDRYVISNQKEMSEWNPKRCSRLHTRQTALLCAACDACTQNGIILYITCSISPEENEMLITKVLKKRDLVPLDISVAATTISHTHTLEQKTHGYMIMPDTSHNTGPLFMCMLQKLNSKNLSAGF